MLIRIPHSWLLDFVQTKATPKQIAEKLKIKLPNKPFRKEILVTERVKPMFKAMVISFKDGIYFS